MTINLRGVDGLVHEAGCGRDGKPAWDLLAGPVDLVEVRFVTMCGRAWAPWPPTATDDAIDCLVCLTTEILTAMATP